jgi:hypothetical protein
VAQHAGLRVTSGATSVDESAALSGFLLLNFFFDDFIFNIFSKSKEIFPDIEPLIFKFSGKFIERIDNNSLDIGESMKVDFELFKLFNTVHNYQFCFRVVSLIEASICVICGINTTSNAIESQTTHVCNDPFWRVVAHNVDGFSVLHSDGMHGLSECIDVLKILLPSPC